MTELLILGALFKHPMSGYDLQIMLQKTHASSWANVRVGSIYYALKHLLSKELIEVLSYELTGKRGKSTYAITTAGSAYYQSSIAKNLERTELTYPVQLYSALNFIEDIDTAKADDALGKRQLKLEEMLHQLQMDYEEKQAYFDGFMPHKSTLVFAHMKRTLESELDLIISLRTAEETK